MSLNVTRLDPTPAARRRRATLTLSVLAHLVAGTAVVVVPLLLVEPPPEVGDAVRAFFVAPRDATPPPPPPPPAARSHALPARVAPLATAALLAPIDVPDQTVEPSSLDLGQ